MNSMSMPIKLMSPFILSLPALYLFKGVGPAVGLDSFLDDGLGLLVGRGRPGGREGDGQAQNPTTHGKTSGERCWPGQ